MRRPCSTRLTRRSTFSRWSGRRWSAARSWSAIAMSTRCWPIRALAGCCNSSDVERIARWATEDLQADLTVVLDAELSDGVHAKSTKDRLESAGDLFHERTRLFFLDLARRAPERYLVLDARASREEIAAQVAARVAPLLSAVARQ